MTRLSSKKALIPFVLAALVAGFALVTGSLPAARAATNFHIDGGGFGHGVGMSQYGALGFAQQGSGYQDILRHYYTGTQIEQKEQPGEVRVWLAGDTTAPVQDNVTASGPTDVVLNGVGVIAHAEASEVIRVEVLNGKFNVYVNDVIKATQVGGDGQNIYIAYNGNPATLDKTGHQYKYGQFELSIPDGSSLRTVLASMNMEDYLKGLGEVPSSWPAEALKTQAVAARTYAHEKITRLGNTRAECGCGVFGDTRDQNYVGYDKETGSGGENWVGAVTATAGQDVTYSGAPIQAFYSSSSGGHTEDSENVFVQALPYLRGVADPYDAANGQNSLHAWSRNITVNEMQSWVNTNASTSVGTLESVEFLDPLGVSGRVIKKIDDTHGGVRISGSEGVKRLNGDSFRSVINAASGKNELPSSLMRLSGISPYGTFPGGVFVAAGPLGGGESDRVVTGADAGGGPHVRVLDTNGAATGVEVMAYDPGFRGGVRVASCHLAGDEGPDSIVTAPGPSGGPHVRTFTSTGGASGGFMAYDPSYVGGIYVACGDVDPNNPGDEIVTGADAGGGPHIKVMDRNGNVLSQFMAYDPAFRGGVRVGVSGDKIVVAPGPGGGPHLRVFGEAGNVVSEWMAYATSFTGGVYVAGGDVVGDGAPEVITGAGEIGAPHVRVFDQAGGVLSEFYAFSTGNDHGARVAAARVPGGAVVAGSGRGGPSLMRVITP